MFFFENKIFFYQNFIETLPLSKKFPINKNKLIFVKLILIKNINIFIFL
jgi:hypothetical protein